MRWLPSTVQNKKFHKTADRNGARGEVTYHASSIDRSHYVLLLNIRRPPITYTPVWSCHSAGQPGKSLETRFISSERIRRYTTPHNIKKMEKRQENRALFFIFFPPEHKPPNHFQDPLQLFNVSTGGNFFRPSLACRRPLPGVSPKLCPTFVLPTIALR